jgi:hypothetical protein
MRRILLKVLISNINYIASGSAPIPSKVNIPERSPLIKHVGTDDSEKHTASFFRVEVSVRK